MQTTSPSHKAAAYSAHASFFQQRLWFLDQFQPNAHAYHLPARWWLDGDLNVHALEKSIAESVRRHDALRTTFSNETDDVLQVIQPFQGFALQVADLTSEPNPEKAALELSAVESTRRFDLAAGPLFRAKLCKVSERKHLLCLVMHHVISDGWSLNVLFDELSAAYATIVAGQEPNREPLSLQYAEFSDRQRELQQGDAYQEKTNFWTQYLTDAPTASELPTDHPRPARSSYRGEVADFELGEDLHDRLRQLCRQLRASMFMTMFAAFNVLLQGYCRQRDICVGYPVANRGHLDVEQLIGLFINTLVLRTRLSPDQSFESLVVQVRDGVLDGDEHQDFPFERLVESLHPDRDLSRHPVFQLFFSFATGQAQMELSGLDVSPVAIRSATSKFDLSMYISESSSSLSGAIEYSTDLFEPDTICRFIDGYKAVLAAVVADPKARISDLPTMSRSTRSLIVEEWNKSSLEVPRQQCIHELFEEQVERSPVSIAIEFEGRALTYRELNSRANRVAHYLRSVGITSDSTVGICCHRSLDMVIGLLGILKSGAAYLPLDPHYPAARLEFMLADSNASMVLSQTELRAVVPQFDHVLYLDTDAARFDECPDHNPLLNTSPEQTAYCIYTSGSTGTPKGVALRHSNAVAFLTWAKQAFGNELSSRVLCSTSICFDLSVFELFAPLASGGTVALVESILDLSQAGDSQPGDPAPAIINTVPSAAQSLLDSQALPKSTRIINLAGEPLTRSLADQLLDALPNARLYNLYGPTEYTTYATFCEVKRGEPRVTIGRPLANTQVYILNEFLLPVPIGVPGEIYIAGSGLMTGYLNRPALTAERCVPDPFDELGGRMYKTGDLGRFLPSGEIEFLGRLDHQVKVRGFRIELGEIEAAMAAYPGIRETVVVVQSNNNEMLLVAHVVARDGEEVLLAGLKNHLAETLPDYMIPTGFVIHQTLPLTPNGKIDRRELSVFQPSLPKAEDSQPRTETEVKIAEIWQAVLGLPYVGREDDFFDLGGHSLRVIRVIDRVKRDLGAVLSVGDLFMTPTVAELAEKISRQVAAATATRPEPAPFACLNFGPTLAQNLGPEFQLLALNTLDKLDRKVLDDSPIEQMASYCLLDLMAAQPTGPYRLSGYCAHAVVAFEMARQLVARGDEVALLVLFDPPWHWAGFHHRLIQSGKQLLKTILKRATGPTAPGPRPVWESVSRAAKKYRPKEYAGRMELFAATSYDTLPTRNLRNQWRDLAVDGCHFEVLSRCPHQSMFAEPYIDELCRRLRIHLVNSYPPSGRTPRMAKNEAAASSVG